MRDGRLLGFVDQIWDHADSDGVAGTVSGTV
jgi:hypothetical protein